MEWFESYENGQMPIRILDPGIRDPNRIFGIFLDNL